MIIFVASQAWERYVKDDPMNGQMNNVEHAPGLAIVIGSEPFALSTARGLWTASKADVDLNAPADVAALLHKHGKTPAEAARF